MKGAEVETIEKPSSEELDQVLERSKSLSMVQQETPSLEVALEGDDNFSQLDNQQRAASDVGSSKRVAENPKIANLSEALERQSNNPMTPSVRNMDSHSMFLDGHKGSTKFRTPHARGGSVDI